MTFKQIKLTTRVKKNGLVGELLCLDSEENPNASILTYDTIAKTFLLTQPYGRDFFRFNLEEAKYLKMGIEQLLE